MQDSGGQSGAGAGTDGSTGEVVEAVQFAEGTREEYKSALVGFGPQLATWMVMSVIFVPTVLLFGASAWVLGRFGRRGLVAFLGVVICTLLVAFGARAWRSVRRAYSESMELTKLPMSVDGVGRVRCLGRQATVRKLGPVPTEPFEPVIVRVVVATKPSPAFVWTWVISGLLSLAGVLVLFRYGVPSLGGRGNPLMSFMYFHIAFGASVGSLVATFVFPTYLRIAPGRLDVFRFPALGLGKPETRSFDLRRLKVTVLLNQSTVVLQSPGDPGHQFVSYSASFDRLATSRAILAAAISPHPTPPLREDALLD